MFTMTVPWWEIALRAACLYAVLFALIRITGKRQIGQFTPFDLILLMLLSEQVSPALSGGDQSMLGALIGIAVLVALNFGITFATSRSQRVERVVEGRPQFLIREGRVDYAMLRRESVSKNDLMAAVRESGCMRPSQVDWAVLETSGTITVRKRGD